VHSSDLWAGQCPHDGHKAVRVPVDVEKDVGDSDHVRHRVDRNVRMPFYICRTVVGWRQLTLGVPIDEQHVGDTVCNKGLKVDAVLYTSRFTVSADKILRNSDILEQLEVDNGKLPSNRVWIPRGDG